MKNGFSVAGSTLLLALLMAMAGVVQAEQQVRVGIYDNPPKLYTDDQRRPQGIFVELLEALAKANDWQLLWVPCHWQSCLAQLETGSLDLLPDVAWSEARAEQFRFHTVPVLHSWSQIYQADGHLLQSIPELDGLRLAVLDGSIQQQHLQRQAEDFGIDIRFYPVDSYQAAFIAVQQGEADAAAANHKFGDLQAAAYGLRPTPIMFQPSRLFFAGSPTADPALMSEIDAQLQDWRSDPASVYFAILRNWQHSESTVITRIPAWLWWLAGFLLLLLLLVSSFSLLLHRQVKLKTRHLKHSEEHLSTILNSVDACIFIKDRQLRYTYVNHKVTELFGIRPEQVIGLTDAQLFDEKTAERLRLSDLQVLEGGQRLSEEEHNTLIHNNETRSFISVKLPLRTGDGRIYALCGIATDITDLRQMQQQAHHLAFFDPLTNLPNRRLLMDRLQHALVSHQRSHLEGALIFIDIDQFKVLNDTRGLSCGDQLLCQVAERLSAQVRASDTVARLGADEFAVLLENLEGSREAVLQNVQRIAATLQQQLGMPYLLQEENHVCTASMGLVMLSEGSNNAEELLKRADLAMVEAKTGERGGMRFFNPVMQAEANRRASLEKELREAIARQQLQLHLQPQLDEAGNLYGMEALLRWQHPTEGAVSPGEFIPLAEHSGLIIPLGNWVLQQACRQLAKWTEHPQFGQLILAVNISPRQFRQPAFVDSVLQHLREHGVAPNRLELEITESLLIDDLDSAIRRLRQLKQHGLRLSLDDFGTGYASLSYLKRLPLDQLKIDQSFVRDLLSDPSDEAIVRTIIALGNSMEMEVIAEGVETAEQLQRLQQLGCRHFQGYLFGRPAPASHWEQQASQLQVRGQKGC